MSHRLALLAALLVFALLRTASAAELTALETRWLKGLWPVVSHAREQLALPLDIVVQPQDAPGAAPLALGFVDGRCKLVLSLRGNPAGERQLAAIASELRPAALELMAAHEVGHCRRYLQGAWFRLPAGFVAARVPEGLAPELQQAWLDMRSTRREEAYGDLVGLAWIAARHAGLYARVHAWLVAERSTELLPGSHHDTLAWLARAADREVWQGPDLFEAADRVWREGLDD